MANTDKIEKAESEEGKVQAADDAAHGHGHDEEIAHTTPVSLLLGVWGGLMVLTVVTVWAANLGLGSQISFTLAMIIATVKAGLVIAYFMHLRWDRRMNLLAFLASFLFVVLFISISLTDKSEYEPDIKRAGAEEQQ